MTTHNWQREMQPLNINCTKCKGCARPTRTTNAFASVADNYTQQNVYAWSATFVLSVLTRHLRCVPVHLIRHHANLQNLSVKETL